MKSKLLLGALSLPIAYAGVIAFHPGIAYAAPAFRPTNGHGILQKAGGYTVDPWHTSIGFEIDHLGLSRVQGRFDKVSGHIDADPKNIGKSKVTFTIKADSVDTNVAPRDADLRSPNFFDVATYPEITFVSTNVKKHGNGYVVDGNLTMHGVTRPISIPFKQYGPVDVPQMGTRAGIVADPVIVNREDYGMHFDVPMLGSKVTVRISLEGTPDKASS